MKTEVTGLLTALGRDMDGSRTIWFRGEPEGYVLPPELFEQAWKLLGTEVRVVATPEGKLQSIIPVPPSHRRSRR